MTMTKSDVKVNISVLSAPKSSGFGYPLIIAHTDKSPVDYTECTELEDVLNAGFSEDSAVYKAASLMLMQDNAPEKFAVYSSESKTAEALPNIINNDWRQLIAVTAGAEDDSTVAEVAKAANAEGKVYFANAQKETDYYADGVRMVAFYYPKNSDGEEIPVCPEAALVGATAGRTAGSFTYKNIVLKGLTERNVSDEDLIYKTGVGKNVHENYFISAASKAGDIVTTEGMTVCGEYIDILDAKDYIISQLTYQTQQALNINDKIPYDNNGIGMLENVCVNVLREAYNNGIIASNGDGSPAYTVNYGLRSETDEKDRKERRYILGRFTATLSGAVHSVEINGSIEI